MFLFEVITWVPLLPGSSNIVCYLPRPKPSVLVASRLFPGVGLGVNALVYIQLYIDIYIRVSLGGHNLDIIC